MPRPHRHDVPDSWHHVLNRGLAKRTVFETDRDGRFFLSLLAREVRAGRLEIHAYCLMLNHFHLLVRSVNGELSEAMRRIQNRYARYFNRTRRRDGPLFRGRFKSRPIDSLRYRRTVVGYIHDNAVKAGLVRVRSDYHWSSARGWSEGRPRWLSRDWVAGELIARGFDTFDEDAMAEAFPSSLDDDHRDWVERQLRDRHEEEAEDRSLKHSASPGTVRWTVRKARLADGTRPWRPVCPARLVERILEHSKGLARMLGRILPTTPRRATTQLLSGLLRMLSGCSHREIALRTRRHRGTVSHDIADHRERLDGNAAYAALASKLTTAILAAVGV